MAETSFVPKFDVSIGGQPAPAEMTWDLIEIVVDDSLFMPDMFTLRLYDREFRWVDSDLLAVGAEVEIQATAASQGTRSGASEVLVKGEITAIEPDFSRTGEALLIVRGYDRSHRLHRGKKTRSFLRATDGEIAERIAREAKLRPKIDYTPVVHDYVIQDDQTDWEFLQARAQRIGYEVYVKDETLFFSQRQEEQALGPELEWGQDLRDFRPRLTTMNQVDEVIVRGWDGRGKREIVGRARRGEIGPEVGVGQSGARLTAEAFGVAAQAVVVDRPVANVSEANIMAQALCDERAGDFIQAEGACFGDPRIRAGQVVTISGVGLRFSGRYFVTSATHIHNEDGYETLFHISGRKPGNLSTLLAGENGGNREWGMAIGLVTNNRDPEGLGRVKVRLPWLADREETAWARIAAPMAGQDMGFYCLPEINDEVLVAFEHGAIQRPYVLGVLWNSKDHPPKQNREVVGRDGKVNQRIIRSRSGHEIILDDTQGHEKIIIRDKTARNEVSIDSRNNNLAIRARGDLILEAEGEVRIQSRSNLKIESQSGLSVESNGNMALKTRGRGSVSGDVVSIDGGNLAEIKAALVKLN